MKTNMFTQPFAVFASAIRFAVQGLAIVFLCIGMADSNTSARVLTTAEMAMPAGTFAAMADLTPAASNSATLVINPMFQGWPDFEGARLSGSFVDANSVLIVTLSGFSGNELPEGETLGVITVRESGIDRAFAIQVDGGVTVLVDLEL